MRIVVVGDSLGLPRPHRINNYSPTEAELAVSYDETYSSILNLELLRKYNFDPYVEVLNRTQRFYTIKNIYQEFTNHLFFFNPDIIVMQVGIVDCWFREQLNGKQMVNKEEYEKYLQGILEMLQNRPACRLIIVGIAPTSVKMDDRYKGINKEINAYNNIIKFYVNNKTVFYVDLEKHIKPSLPEEYLLPDDHHLNKNGNKLLSGKLLKRIISFIESDKGVYLYNMEKYDEALVHLYQSFKTNPLYIDNLYNLLVLTYQLENKEKYNEIKSYIETNELKSDELIDIINQISKLA